MPIIERESLKFGAKLVLIVGGFGSAIYIGGRNLLSSDTRANNLLLKQSTQSARSENTKLPTHNPASGEITPENGIDLSGQGFSCELINQGENAWNLWLNERPPSVAICQNSDASDCTLFPSPRHELPKIIQPGDYFCTFNEQGSLGTRGVVYEAPIKPFVGEQRLDLATSNYVRRHTPRLNVSLKDQSFKSKGYRSS